MRVPVVRLRAFGLGAGVGLALVSSFAAAMAWSSAPAQDKGADPGPAMVKAASAFLGALDDDRKAIAKMAYDDPQRLDWHWIPKPRKGLTLSGMTEEQKRLGMELLRTALSESGFEKAKIIMAMEEVLRIQEKDDSGRRDPEKYHWTIFGEPGETGVWGWSVEGHHFSVNCVVKDSELVSATPLFMGLNPRRMNAEADYAPVRKDATPLAAEEEVAILLYSNLTEDQRAKAFLGETPPPTAVTGPPSDLWSGEPRGLPASEMNADQKKALRVLIEAYCARLNGSEAGRLLKEIDEAGFDKVHLSWYGSGKLDENHQYIVQGPTFILHLDNTQACPLGNPANHIHSAWRTPARDFGKGLEGR